MLQTKTVIFFLLLIFTSAQSDVIYLKNSKPLFGQLVFIGDNNIRLEKIDPEIKIISETSVPVFLVEKVVDESGTILFNDKTRKENLTAYYSPIKNNWEEIKFYYADSVKDYIRLKDGRIIEGLIISVEESFLFVDSGLRRGEIINLNKVNLKDIDQVNQTKLIQAIGRKPKPKEYRYNINLGVNLYQTKVDRLTQILETNFPTETIKRRNSFYSGAELSLKAWLLQKVAIGLGIQLFGGSNNQVYLSDIFVTYRFKTTKFKPLISAGISGINLFSDEQLSNSEIIEIDMGQIGAFISPGIEWDLSEKYAFYSNFSFYAFGKKRIRGEDITLIDSELELSFFRFSAGLRYAF